MDELERRLRQDAARIEAEVPPELAERIRARIAAESRIARVDESPSPFRLWAFASLSGVAAVLLLMLLPDAEPPSPPVDVASTAPLPDDLAREFPLQVKTAELTAPLERELENLRSDLEKAREKVEDDLAF
jgi:hypothetical protein